MNADIIIPLVKWRKDGHKLIDWCVINVGRKGVDWEHGIYVTYVPTLGQCKYAMIRINDERLDLMFRMLFPEYISSLAKEISVKGMQSWVTTYD